MEKVFLGLGSNLGDRAGNLERAVAGLREISGLYIDRLSRIYQTEPVGLDDNSGWFLNQVVMGRAEIGAAELLAGCLGLEDRLGRVRREGLVTSRVIDIDILFYGSKVISEEGLTVPHPEIGERLFVLVPLSELAGEELHPVTGMSIRQMLDELLKTSRQRVKLYDETDIHDC